MTQGSVRVGLVLVWTVLASVASIASEAAEAISPRLAIERAVFDRLGSAVVRVDVDTVTTTVESHPALVAIPDPAAYVGNTVRFALTVGGRRLGTAVASVRVRAQMARVVKVIERDQSIEAADVTVVEDEVHGVRFGRLPRLADVVGARARRDIAPGVIVTKGMFAAPLDVQNGDRVVVGVTVGRVHVTGEGVASGSGYVGDVVRVIQPGRRGSLKARITERGVVEVLR